jgi:hypothetical protein
MNQLIELKALWLAVLGEPIPSDNQFLTWLALHGLATAKIGIAKASAKHLSLGGTMSENHKIRFASKVMLTKTNDPQKASSLAKARIGQAEERPWTS